MNTITTFWGVWNESRCKTAMLLISLIVVFGVVASELGGVDSEFLRAASLTVIGYWIGRHSKHKEGRA